MLVEIVWFVKTSILSEAQTPDSGEVICKYIIIGEGLQSVHNDYVNTVGMTKIGPEKLVAPAPNIAVMAASSHYQPPGLISTFLQIERNF